MERLTKKALGCFKFTLKDHKPKTGEFAEYEAFFDYSMAVKRLGEYEDTGLTPEQVEDMKKSLKQYDEDRIAAQQECGSVCEDAIEMHQQIEAQQQDIDILNMGIAELRESNQALKDYAGNADADKDEQAGRIMQMDYLLRRALPILEVANDQQELIQAINAMLGGAEDGK